jgi:predicted phosphodiesterase
MARYGVIADVHGNLEALAAALAALERRGVDRVISLGDVVGYNGESNECVGLLRERGIESIAGNHELIALGHMGFERCAMRPAFTLRQTRRDLSAGSRAFLGGLPLGRVLEDRIALIHGSVDDPGEYLTTAARAAASAGRLRARLPEIRLCLFAHTHAPALYEIDGAMAREHPATGVVTLAPRDRLWMVNPGSVDASRRPIKLAELAVVDSEAGTVEFARVSYDAAKVERSAAAKGYRMSRADEVVFSAARWLRLRERAAARIWRETIDLVRA